MKTEPTTSELFESYVAPTYGRFPLTMTRARGSEIWDEDGKRYLDFGTGIAVCPIGHRHPAITAALHSQAEQLVHCSNLYHIREQGLLAQHIVEKVVEAPGKVFFGNSGAEANEGLIKLARKHGQEFPQAGGKPRYEVLTFNGSFHGRTMAGISATGNPKVKAGFEPLLDGFQHLPFNDIAALELAVSPNTVAILLEPVQGEGGINAATPEFLRAISKLCKERHLLLMLDEVQCGLGRLGRSCAWKAILDDPEFHPDAISWAKGLGGGIPIGAFWVSDREVNGKALSSVLGPGTHGSTFGGNPLVSATSLAVLQEIESQKLAENAIARGHQLMDTIRGWDLPIVKEVRGTGLMIGIVLDEEKLSGDKTASLHAVTKLMEAGLLTIPAQTNVVRLLPALDITEDDANEALAILESTFKSL